MQANLLTFRRVYWRLGAVIWMDFYSPLQVARLRRRAAPTFSPGVTVTKLFKVEINCAKAPLSL